MHKAEVSHLFETRVSTGLDVRPIQEQICLDGLVEHHIYHQNHANNLYTQFMLIAHANLNQQKLNKLKQNLKDFDGKWICKW